MVNVVHHVVCRHQIEVEIWPAAAEVYFRDERFAEPVNTQVRFDAVVHNATTAKVKWEVRDLTGTRGAGSIDPSGLYVAPPKGSLPHGLTEVVVATPVEDPLRKAFAWVTLIGCGPAPVPEPHIEIWPKQAYLYYPDGYDNAYMDPSNRMRLFRAALRNSPTSEVEWLVDNVVQVAAGTAPWFLYQVTGFGITRAVAVATRIKGQPHVRGEARVIQINYSWPGLV
jgi:hypothetical protein